VAQYANGNLKKILAPGDPIPGGTVPQFDALVSISGNSREEVAFEVRGVPLENSGLYLLRRDGQVVRILSHGDQTPATLPGGTFALTYSYRSASLPQTGLIDMNPQVNDSGEVLFVAAMKGANTFPAAGIFVYRAGGIYDLVLDGETLAQDSSHSVRLEYADYFSYTLLNKIAFGPQGEVVFTAWLVRYPGDISFSGVFRITNGGIYPIAVTGDSAPDAAGKFSPDFTPFIDSNRLGDILFQSNLFGSTYPRGIFRASLPSPVVPNAGFEASAPGGPPEHWTTTWTNSGKGEAGQYDSGGQDSYEGNAGLRLHVAAGGGAVFVVSDPVPIDSFADFYLQCRMRYNLASASDSVYFTVIQTDDHGNTVGVDEMRATAGDNFWNWQPARLLFSTATTARFIRIRFGLIASSESNLDVDAVGARESP
jgi:hypothetical protein